MPKLTPASVEKHKPNKHHRREISDAAALATLVILAVLILALNSVFR